MYKWFELLDVVDKNKIMRMEQNIPRPKTGTMIGYKRIAGPFKTGLTDNVEHVSDSIFKTWGHREMTYSVQVYRQDAMQIAALIHDSIEVQAVRDLLRESFISIIDISSPSDISLKIETGFEERANVDIRLRAMSEWDIDKGVIETVGIAGTLTSENKDDVVI